VAPAVGTTAATVATSPYAASVEDVEDEEEEKARARPKLAANGRYVLMSESEIRSERGERDQKIARDVPKEYTRTLYDYPKDPSTDQFEMYRQAHPSEISDPTEFTTYLRDVKPAIGKRKELRFNLPTVAESTETLQALHDELETKGKPEAMTARTTPGDNEKAPLTEEDIPRLRQQWYEEFKDILEGTLEELPPLREVNHEINLIDPDKKYTHRLPTCPVPLQAPVS
jgi:hypothetical protein